MVFRGVRSERLLIVMPALCGHPEKNMDKSYYVYLLAKARNSTFYIGMTSDLSRRVWEHKNEIADGFTKKIRH